MSNGNEQMQTEFHNKANNAFFSVYHAFENAVSAVSRRRDEYKFQQLKKQYVLTLEQQLLIAAKDVLARYRNAKQVNEMDQMFSQFIKDYLHRFVQKVNDL
jgi:hypothetical protein